MSRPKQPKKTEPKYIVQKDTREQQGWYFGETEHCAGTIDECLKVADYSLVGFTDIFLIERKFTPSELAGNIVGNDEIRFRKELTKLNEIDHPYVIFEFDLADLINYPWSDSSIPISVKRRIKVKGRFLVHKLIAIQTDFPKIQFIFAGSHGAEMASVIFKRISKMYPERLDVAESD